MLAEAAGAVVMSIIRAIVVLAVAGGNPFPADSHPRPVHRLPGRHRRHGPAILSGARVTAGAILTVNRIAGLIQKG